MSEIKLFSVLLVLIFVSCALSVGEFEDDSPGSGSEVSSNGSTELSSSSKTGVSSSSIIDASSSSVINASSSSATGVSSSSRTSTSSSSKKEDSSSSSEDLPKYGDDFTYGGQTYKTVIIGTQTWMESNLNYEPGSPSGITKCYAEGYGQDDWYKPDSDADKIKSNCDKYGRLYDWVTAMNLPANCSDKSCGSQVNGKHQGVCPSGWHIPSRDEWNVLKKYVFDIIWKNYEDEDFGWGVGTKLKATSGWKEYPKHGNGVDTYGFNAIGSGYCFNCTYTGLNTAAGGYSGIGERGDGNGEFAYWWSATEYVNQNLTDKTISKNAYRFTVNYSGNDFIEKNEFKSDLYSVRCVKN